MKKQILNHLHTLASDMEKIGLGKYAEKVNDIFEKIAETPEERTARESRYDAASERLEWLTGKKPGQEPTLPSNQVTQVPSAINEGQIIAQLRARIPQELQTEKGISDWVKSGTNSPEQIKMLLDMRLTELFKIKYANEPGFRDPNFKFNSNSLQEAIRAAKIQGLLD